MVRAIHSLPVTVTVKSITNCDKDGRVDAVAMFVEE